MDATDLTSLRMLHAIDTVPPWSTRVQSFASRPDVSAAELDAALDGPHVPGTRRTIGFPSLGQAASDVRLRLFDTLVAGTNDADCLSAAALGRVLVDPHAAHIDGLELGDAAAMKASLAALDHTSLTSIRRLTLRTAPSPEMLAMLLAHPRLAQLENLAIFPGQSLGDARVNAILRSPVVAVLRRLAMSGCDKLANKTFDALGSANLDALQSFMVNSMTWLPRKGARAPLLTAPWFGRLRVLRLDGVGTDELDTLARRLDLGRIVALDLVLGAGKEPASPKATKPLVAKLRMCNYLGIMGPHPGSFIPGLADLLRPIAGELEDVGVPIPPAETATFADVMGPTWRDRAVKRRTEAGFSWKWFW